MKTVNIITVFYNSSHCYEDYFHNLQKTGYPFKLTIVDNASRPNEINQLRVFLMTYRNRNMVDFEMILNEKNLMFTPAVNKGMDDSDYQLLLNPDTFYKTDNWLKQAVEFADSVNASITGFRLVNKDGKINHAGAFTIGDGMEMKNNMHRGYGQYSGFDKADRVDWVTGAVFLISKETIQRVGKLPLGGREEFRHYHSDREYCRMVRDNGLDVWYCPITIGHLHNRSSNFNK